MAVRLSLTVLCLVAGTVFASTKSFTGYQVLRVVPATYEQLEKLHELRTSFSELDFWTELGLKRNVDINVPPSLVAFMSEELVRLGLEVTVTQEDVQRLIDAYQPKNSQETLKEMIQELVEKTVKSPDVEKLISGNSASLDWLRKEIKNIKESVGEGTMPVVGGFPRYTDILAWMERMRRMYPDLCKIEDIGMTFEGRPQRLIKIGTRADHVKPAIWVDGGIHAREWLTVGSSIWLIHKMLTEYNSNLNVTIMLDHYDWYMMPVFNADGYEYTHTTNRLWRKTVTPNKGSSCLGVDPNRNFGFYWGTTGANSNPCTDSYDGSHPFSVPCTKNVRTALLLLEGRLELYVNLHTFGDDWLSPYAAKVPPPPNSDQMIAVARRAALAIYDKTAVRYKFGEAAQTLYPAPGAVFDWAKGVAGANYSYAVELGPTRNTDNGFIVPTSFIRPTADALWAALVEVATFINEKNPFNSTVNIA